MAQPNDYVSPLLTTSINPAQSFGQGLAVGNGLIDNQRAAVDDQRKGLLFAQAQQDRSAAIEHAKAQMIAQAQESVAEQEAMEEFDKNPTATGALRNAARFPKRGEGLMKIHAALAPEEQRQRVAIFTAADAALAGGSPAVAADGLRRAGLAYENTKGREEEAKPYYALADLIDNDDTGGTKGRAATARYLASVAPKEYAAIATDLEKLPAVVAKEKADAKVAETDARFAADRAVEALALSTAQRSRYEAQSKLESERLGIERQKLRNDAAALLATVTNPQMTPADRNAAADAAIAASAAKMGAAKANALADKFAGFDKNKDFSDTGLHGAAGEAINKARGKPGDFTKDRQAYAVLVDDDIQTRAKESGNKLTDTDYAEQRKLYPDPTGDFALVEQWLRRKAQADENKAANEGARVDWMNANANMAPARAPITVQGVPVAKGETFGQFIERRDTQASADNDKVTISDGKETLRVSRADAVEAAKDGFKEVR